MKEDGGKRKEREGDEEMEGGREGERSTCCSTSPGATATGLGWNGDGLGWPVATSVLD